MNDVCASIRKFMSASASEMSAQANPNTSISDALQHLGQMNVHVIGLLETKMVTCTGRFPGLVNQPAKSISDGSVFLSNILVDHSEAELMSLVRALCSRPFLSFVHFGQLRSCAG